MKYDMRKTGESVVMKIQRHEEKDLILRKIEVILFSAIITVHTLHMHRITHPIYKYICLLSHIDPFLCRIVSDMKSSRY